MAILPLKTILKHPTNGGCVGIKGETGCPEIHRSVVKSFFEVPICSLSSLPKHCWTISNSE